MKNGMKQAFPMTDGERVWEDGLTKREYLAAMAMQGILSNPEVNITTKELARYSVEQADELLNALDS